MHLPELIAAGAAIVDVRSRNEFSSGSHRKAINIPLDTLERQLKTLNPAKPVIVCCASGARSAVAERLLSGAGFTQVVNAGSWANIPA